MSQLVSRVMRRVVSRVMSRVVSQVRLEGQVSRENKVSHVKQATRRVNQISQVSQNVMSHPF